MKSWAPSVPAIRHKWLSCLLNYSTWYKLEYMFDLSSPFPTSTLRNFKIHFVFYFSWQWWFPRLKIVVLQTSQCPCIQSQYFTSITNRYIVLILLQICKFTFSHIYIYTFYTWKFIYAVCAIYPVVSLFLHTINVLYTDLLSDVFTLIDKYYTTASNHITHISHT